MPKSFSTGQNPVGFFLPDSWHIGEAYDPPILNEMSMGGTDWTFSRLYPLQNHPQSNALLVMIHGVPGSHRDFRYLAPACAAVGFKSIVIDMPGFGSTQAQQIATAQRDRARQVLPLLESMPDEKLILIGHSIGASVALQLAEMLGQRCEGLVLINGVGLSRHRGLRRIPKWPMKHLTKTAFDFIDQGWLEHHLRRYYASAGLKGDYVKRDFLLHASIVGDLDFAVQHYAAERLRIPVLICHSTNDPLIETGIGEEMAHILSRKNRVCIKTFQHGAHFSQKHSAQDIAEAMKRVFVSND